MVSVDGVFLVEVQFEELVVRSAFEVLISGRQQGSA
jgi:hypothetical protein